MRRHSNRSSANVNRIGHYNATDARIDNPHATARQIPKIVREANGIVPRFKPRGAK